MDSERNLTHEEIWDDSALVDSWNQALEEYQKYHSIHAKGGTADDILAAQEENKIALDAKQETNGGGKPIKDQDDEDESVPMDEDESDETSNPTISVNKQSAAAKKAQLEDGSLRDGGPATIGHGPGPGPQVLLGSIQDEELKKLLMSWYYAGYYTGLYEGKQQGLQQAEKSS